MGIRGRVSRNTLANTNAARAEPLLHIEVDIERRRPSSKQCDGRPRSTSSRASRGAIHPEGRETAATNSPMAW
jgi:hypothetical protein